MPATDLLTPGETSFVSGVPVKTVYKVARERLPGGLAVRHGRRLMFRPAAALCVRIDHLLPTEVPLKVRKAFYAAVKRNPQIETLEHTSGLLSYVFDASSVANSVAADLEAYRRAMRVVREDPDIQDGAATFEDTRILVHTIADLLGVGAPIEELKQDYPNLTDTMLAAAPIYARIHPKRGRPRIPDWRSRAGREAHRVA